MQLAFDGTRRKFFEAQGEKPKLARLTLKLIGELYRYEREWSERGWAHDHARVWLRSCHYLRLLNCLKTRIFKHRDWVLHQSQTGKVITSRQLRLTPNRS